MFSKQLQCPECGACEGCRSRPRTFFEKYFLPLFLVRPVRCTNCFRRRNVYLWVHVPAEEDVVALGTGTSGMSMRQYDELMRRWRWWLPR